MFKYFIFLIVLFIIIIIKYIPDLNNIKYKKYHKNAVNILIWTTSIYLAVYYFDAIPFRIKIFSIVYHAFLISVFIFSVASLLMDLLMPKYITKKANILLCIQYFILGNYSFALIMYSFVLYKYFMILFLVSSSLFILSLVFFIKNYLRS